ncbi:MAG: SDR family oxidoreductase [Bacteroidetes bacterium]|nr:SDR family oxidoreductase [Bacteroidota bacterium]
MAKSYFENKVIWITGASSGIGEELAHQFAHKGALLVLSARNEAKLILIKDALANHSKHIVLPLDLEKSEEFETLAKAVFDRFGRIDILVNNGGVSQRANAFETSMEVNRKIMEIDFFGNIALTKVVLPFMQKQKSGQILIMSSIAGKFGFFLRSAYSAAKHALHGYYESLALEEEHNGISVTIVCPGKINTPISTNAINAEGNKHGIMDHNQKTGMPVDVCVNQMLKALEKKKREVLIGNKEIWAVRIKRFFPLLFWKIIKNQSPT